MADEAIPASENPIDMDATTTEVENDAPVSSSDDSEQVKEPVLDFTKTKHKVKVDDNELEVDYDELVKGYQTMSAGQKRLREASEIRSQVDKVIEAFKSGDHKRFVDLVGKESAVKIANQLLLEEIENDMLPEHEKTIRQLRKEKEDAEQILAKQKEEQELQKQQAENQQAAEQIEGEIVEAIKEKGIKVTKRMVARAAEVMEAHYLSTGQPISASKAFDYVIEDQQNDFLEFIGGLSKEQAIALKKRLPKSFIESFRNDDVQDYLSDSVVGRSDEPARLPKKKDKKRRMTTQDWFSEMDKKFRNG